MSRTLTASDRSALIRLASTLPAGSEERRAILAGLSKKASGGITMWTADMSADFIVGGEYTDYTFATVTTNKIEKELLSEADGIGKASGGSYKVGRVMFLGTPKGFRYAVRIRVTGVPFGSTVGAIESKARGARKVQWGELEFAPKV